MASLDDQNHPEKSSDVVRHRARLHTEVIKHQDAILYVSNKRTFRPHTSPNSQNLESVTTQFTFTPTGANAPPIAAHISIRQIAQHYTYEFLPVYANLSFRAIHNGVDSPVIVAIECGNLNKLISMLEKGTISVNDCFENGKSLLMV